MNEHFSAASESAASRIPWPFFDFAGGAAGPWSNDRIADHLKEINFSKDVSVVTIPKGTLVAQWVNPARGVGNYFAPVGTDAGQLGISSVGKEVQQFNVTEDTSVLQSTAAPILDTWSGDVPVQTPGGGTQWFTVDKANFQQIGGKWIKQSS